MDSPEQITPGKLWVEQMLRKQARQDGLEASVIDWREHSRLELGCLVLAAEETYEISLPSKKVEDCAIDSGAQKHIRECLGAFLDSIRA